MNANLDGIRKDREDHLRYMEGMIAGTISRRDWKKSDFVQEKPGVYAWRAPLLFSMIEAVALMGAMLFGHATFAPGYEEVVQTSAGACVGFSLLFVSVVIAMNGLRIRDEIRLIDILKR